MHPALHHTAENSSCNCILPAENKGMGTRLACHLVCVLDKVFTPVSVFYLPVSQLPLKTPPSGHRHSRMCHVESHHRLPHFVVLIQLKSGLHITTYCFQLTESFSAFAVFMIFTHVRGAWTDNNTVSFTSFSHMCV